MLSPSKRKLMKIEDTVYTPSLPVSSFAMAFEFIVQLACPLRADAAEVQP
jgi:hypothetical protein